MQNYRDTLPAQYANSPTITELVTRLNDSIAPEADIEAFFEKIWNINTADDAGLDTWGRIVGVGRYLQIDAATVLFSFAEQLQAGVKGDSSTTPQPFNGAGNFYNTTGATTTYRLAYDAYRKLIMAKAMSNICAASVPSINRLLQYLFEGRGRCYVQDTGGMGIRYMFEFFLTLPERYIVLNSGVFPRPSGVKFDLIELDTSATFGFSEAALLPFGSGTFFSSYPPLIDLLQEFSATMQIADLRARLLRAFASGGLPDTIPATQTDPARASYDVGFTQLNMTPLAAGGVPPSGRDVNEVLYDLSNTVLWSQALGVTPWSSAFATNAATGGHPQYALVTYNGTLYQSSIDNNTSTPGSGTNWMAAKGVTPAASDNSTTLVTTAFVKAQNYQASVNRTVGGNDNATGTVTDTGGNLSVPVPVTVTAEASSATQQATGMVTLRSVVQTILNNIAYILATLAGKQATLNRTVQTNLASTTAASDSGGNITPGVTGTLGITNGGTGAATAAAALTALGTAPLSSVGNFSK